MRKAAAGIFLMVTLALATTAVQARPSSSLGRRSRFLPTLEYRSCSNEGDYCGFIVDPHGAFRYDPDARCCNGVCIDTEFNANQCGECNYACWGSSWICCYGDCVNPMDDPDHCGGCGNYCGDDRCFNGVCGYAV